MAHNQKEGDVHCFTSAHGRSLCTQIGNYISYTCIYREYWSKTPLKQQLGHHGASTKINGVACMMYAIGGMMFATWKENSYSFYLGLQLVRVCKLSNQQIVKGKKHADPACSAACFKVNKTFFESIQFTPKQCACLGLMQAINHFNKVFNQPATTVTVWNPRSSHPKKYSGILSEEVEKIFWKWGC